MTNQPPNPAQPALLDPDLARLETLSGALAAAWNPREGRFRLAPGLREALGNPGVDRLEDFETLLHADDLTPFSEALRQHQEDGTTMQLEVRLCTGEGTPRWHAVWAKGRRSRKTLPLDGEEVVLFLEDIQTRKDEAAHRQSTLKNTQGLIQEMNVLSELSQALTTRLGFRDVLEETYRQTSRLVDTSNFFIALYVPEKEEIHFVYDVTDSEQDKNELTIVPATRGVTGYIIRTKAPVLIKESYLQWTAERGIPVLGEPALSWLGVPMLIGDRVLGVIAVQHYKIANLYDEHSLDLLMAIAGPTAIAIQNARLFEERKQVEADLQDRSDRITKLVKPMLEGIESIARLTQEKQQTLHELARMIQESHQKLKVSDEYITEVAANVDDMINMVNIIGNISTTVNLLALNATIEAAHAGGLGHGFAVIAGEIRKLSDSTESQAQEIASSLETMTLVARESAQASRESFATFGQTEAITRDIMAFLDELNQRLVGLSDTSERILQAMNRA